MGSNKKDNMNYMKKDEPLPKNYEKRIEKNILSYLLKDDIKRVSPLDLKKKYGFSINDIIDVVSNSEVLESKFSRGTTWIYKKKDTAKKDIEKILHS